MSKHWEQGFLSDFSNKNVYTGGELNAISMEETELVLNEDAIAQAKKDKLAGKKSSVTPPFIYALTATQRRDLEKEGLTAQLENVMSFLKSQQDKDNGKEDPDEDQFLGGSTEDWMMVGEGLLAGIAAKKQARFDAGNSWGDTQLKLKAQERDISQEMTGAIKDAEVLALQQEAIAKDRNTSRRLRIHDKFGSRKIAAMNSLQNTINKALT